MAAGLEPWERGFLNAVAKRESAGEYNVRWNGPGNAPAYFEDFKDHPRIFVDNGAGDVSSAAGRYQITASTWDSLPARFRVGGFTPENQDRAALYLAEQRFNAQLGAGEDDFRTIMRNGTTEQILSVKRALGSTWAALGDGSMTDQEFLNIFRGSEGIAGGGTGTPTLPNIWEDERYTGMSFDQRMNLSGQAAQTAAAMQSAVDQQKQQTADLLRAALAAGTDGAREGIETAIRNGDVPLDQMDDLLNLTAKDREEERSGQQFIRNAQAGIRMGNTGDNQQAAMRFYQDAGVYAGMQQQDPQAAELFAQTFAQTGVMPPEMETLLSGMIASSDPTQMQYGMSVLNSLRSKDRGNFALAMDADLVEATNAWNIAVRYAPQGDTAAIISRFNEWKSPENRAIRERYEEDAIKLLQEITNDDMLQYFMSVPEQWDMFGQPTLPAAPAALSLFRSDADQLFQQYYPLFQDKKATMEFVAEQMSYNWGRETVGGGEELGLGQLMYLAPSSPAAGYERIRLGSGHCIRADR